MENAASLLKATFYTNSSLHNQMIKFGSLCTVYVMQASYLWEQVYVGLWPCTGKFEFSVELHTVYGSHISQHCFLKILQLEVQRSAFQTQPNI